MRRQKLTPRSTLITFSGLDGSGKSTQIGNLLVRVHAEGFRTELLAFWDDIVVATRYREGFVHKVYGSEKGVGMPDRPVNRRDKNVRRWYLSLARHVLYFADALHLCWVFHRRRHAEVLVIDRYIYDELANLPLANPFTRAFIGLVHWLVPRPDVAFLLDADPEAARARKPEYPAGFMHECRRAYFDLAGLLGTMTIIPPLPLEDAKDAVESAVMAVLKFSAAGTELSNAGRPTSHGLRPQGVAIADLADSCDK